MLKKGFYHCIFNQFDFDTLKDYFSDFLCTCDYLKYVYLFREDTKDIPYHVHCLVEFSKNAPIGAFKILNIQCELLPLGPIEPRQFFRYLCKGINYQVYDPNPKYTSFLKYGGKI